MPSNAQAQTHAPGQKAAASEELNVLAVLKALREGEFIQELQDELSELHGYVLDHGKSVSLNIKLTLSPSGRTITIEDDITPKAPKVPKSGTTFFSDKGQLTRRDPKQIDLQEVDPAFRGRNT
jgi:hypothetical protein